MKDLPIRAYADESGTSYAALFTRVPVLTYRRGEWRAPNQLEPSHVWGQWRVLSDDQTRLLDQPDDFIKWGKKILAWLRKQTPERHGTQRITRKVADAVKSGLEIIV